MQRQENTGTSPAQPVPFAPSLLLQCRKNQTPVRHPLSPGTRANRSRATLNVPSLSQKGVPGREMPWHHSVCLAGPQATAAGHYRQPPGRNIEKTGAYKRVTRGRARAKRTITAQESSSVPSPCAHGTRKRDLAAKSPARSTRCRGSRAFFCPLFQGAGLQPPWAASPSQPHAAERSNPDPGSLCPILAAGRAAPGSRCRSWQSLGPLPVTYPGRATGEGDGEQAPSQKLGRPVPCEGPERGWGRETGQASLFVCNRKF